ncbi:MAG: hypothetical protein HC843_08475 [Sphingomonadales bacterium]|nr:hypothetical protein [Sphingomonadales bacterium]
MEITREQATLKRSEARRIASLEQDLTAKYVKAQSLAARDGSVTIKGNEKKAISDQIVTGKQIVSNMESATLISSAGVNPSNPELGNARTTAGFNQDGNPVNIRTTFFNNPSNRDWGNTFGHEMLHPTTAGRIWRNIPEHDQPFDDAARRIR